MKLIVVFNQTMTLDQVSESIAISYKYHGNNNAPLEIGDSGYLHDTTGKCVGSWNVQEKDISEG